MQSSDNHQFSNFVSLDLKSKFVTIIWHGVHVNISNKTLKTVTWNKRNLFEKCAGLRIIKIQNKGVKVLDMQK